MINDKQFCIFTMHINAPSALFSFFSYWQLLSTVCHKLKLRVWKNLSLIHTQTLHNRKAKTLSWYIKNHTKAKQNCWQIKRNFIIVKVIFNIFQVAEPHESFISLSEPITFSGNQVHNWRNPGWKSLLAANRDSTEVFLSKKKSTTFH